VNCVLGLASDPPGSTFVLDDPTRIESDSIRRTHQTDRHHVSETILAVAVDLGTGMVRYAIGAVVELGTLFPLYHSYLWAGLEEARNRAESGRAEEVAVSLS